LPHDSIVAVFPASFLVIEPVLTLNVVIKYAALSLNSLIMVLRVPAFAYMLFVRVSPAATGESLDLLI
jgi:hypothetical protein